MSNPYLELCNIVKEVAPATSPFLLGEVKEKLPNLKITTNNIVLDKEDFLISSTILTLNNAKINCPHDKCNIDHNLKDVLEIGDKVLLVETNGMYILIDKVVSI